MCNMKTITITYQHLDEKNTKVGFLILALTLDPLALTLTLKGAELSQNFAPNLHFWML